MIGLLRILSNHHQLVIVPKEFFEYYYKKLAVRLIIRIFRPFFL